LRTTYKNQDWYKKLKVLIARITKDNPMDTKAIFQEAVKTIGEQTNLEFYVYYVVDDLIAEGRIKRIRDTDNTIKIIGVEK